jgi:hypothetical protein
MNYISLMISERRGNDDHRPTGIVRQQSHGRYKPVTQSA